ncbi:MAG: S-adenosylmethionine:tRNA ribosyltransferase-isomerase [Deltaproteobacteria bacterium]|nr:S-adenosylmethionine:tRNA ribosyltransferase-isomerase [Deltaproteobacteria bacterium]
MKLDDFDFTLPPCMIAVDPLKERDAARVMLVDRAGGDFGETVVSSFPALFRPADLLLLNDTRVLPARLNGQKSTGGKVEIFLVKKSPGDEEIWEALVRSSKPPRSGTRILLPEQVMATVISPATGEGWLISFTGTDDFIGWLDRFEIATLTLHVGLGTFMPIRVDDPLQHKMHTERYCIPQETAAAILRCRERGGRVIAVGTTVARTLEHAAAGSTVKAGSGETDIFIYPGYRFQVVDALLTNFHLPKSTLLMLVAAFAGRERILDAYRVAIERGFRFYSYGDAMFIY